MYGKINSTMNKKFTIEFYFICQINNQYTIQIEKLNYLKPKQLILNHTTYEFEHKIYKIIIWS